MIHESNSNAFCFPVSNDFNKIIWDNVISVLNRVEPLFTDKIIPLEQELLKIKGTSTIYSQIEQEEGRQIETVAHSAFLAGMAFQLQTNTLSPDSLQVEIDRD